MYFKTKPTNQDYFSRNAALAKLTGVLIVVFAGVSLLSETFGVYKYAAGQIGSCVFAALISIAIALIMEAGIVSLAFNAISRMYVWRKLDISEKLIVCAFAFAAFMLTMFSMFVSKKTVQTALEASRQKVEIVDSKEQEGALVLDVSSIEDQYRYDLSRIEQSQHKEESVIRNLYAARIKEKNEQIERYKILQKSKGKSYASSISYVERDKLRLEAEMNEKLAPVIAKYTEKKTAVQTRRDTSAASSRNFHNAAIIEIQKNNQTAMEKAERFKTFFAFSMSWFAAICSILVWIFVWHQAHFFYKSGITLEWQPSEEYWEQSLMADIKTLLVLSLVRPIRNSIRIKLASIKELKKLPDHLSGQLGKERTILTDKFTTPDKIGLIPVSHRTDVPLSEIYMRPIKVLSDTGKDDLKPQKEQKEQKDKEGSGQKNYILKGIVYENGQQYDLTNFIRLVKANYERQFTSKKEETRRGHAQLYKRRANLLKQNGYVIKEKQGNKISITAIRAK